LPPYFFHKKKDGNKTDRREHHGETDLKVLRYDGFSMRIALDLIIKKQKFPTLSITGTMLQSAIRYLENLNPNVAKV
jgi:hypothetical protein